MHRDSRRALRVALFIMPLLTVLPMRAALAGDGAAPTFSVRALDGRQMRLTDFRGKPVVLDFWATWCAPCRASMPHLSRLQDRYRGQGLVVIGLSIDDDRPHEVRRVADQMGVKFRLAMADDRVLGLYGPIRSIPTTIFIDRKGDVVRRVVGYIDGETMETYLLELMN